LRRLFAWEQQVDNFSLTYYYIQNKCIIVGKIVEEGTHKDLIKIKNGYYSRMFDLGVVKYVQKEDSKILKTSNF